MSNKLDEWLVDDVPERKFVEHIGISEGQVRNDERIVDYALNDLMGYDPGLAEAIGSVSSVPSPLYSLSDYVPQ
jgi:hypothetical protein